MFKIFKTREQKANELRDIKRKAQLSFADTIKEWHAEYELKQRELEAAFDPAKLNCIKVNVWDEIDKDDTTFVYVEMEKLPDQYCLGIIQHLIEQLHRQGINNANLRFYDSTTIYPHNLRREEGRYTSFKRWEIHLSNMDYRQLDNIVKTLQQTPPYNGVVISVYSES